MNVVKKSVFLIIITLAIFLLSFFNVKADEEIEIEQIKDYTHIEYDYNNFLEEYYEKIYKDENEQEIIKIYEQEDQINKIKPYQLKYELLNDYSKEYGFNTLEEKNIDKDNNEVIKNTTYYLYEKDNEKIVCSGLYRINDKYYAFNRFGEMLTGLKKIDNQTYYFDLITGEMQLGFKTINGNLHYFNTTGVQPLGLVNINGYYYYMTTNGAVKNSFKTINGNTYYFDNNAHAVKGWFTLGNSTYYFDKTTAIQKNGLVWDSGYYYYISGGKISKSKWIKTNNNYYYFNKYGHAVRGIIKLNKKYYYLNNYYHKQTGLITYNGYKWYISSKGNMTKSKWKKIGKYKYYFNKKGHASRGIIKLNKKYYYLNNYYHKQTGLINHNGYTWYISKKGNMTKSKWKTINKKTYYFNRYGHAVKGIVSIKKKYYFFNSNGAMQNGFIYSGGRYYYINKGKIYKNMWIYANSKMYYLGSNGASYMSVKTTISGVVYNFNSQGNTTHGYYTEGDNTYYQDGNGNLLTGWRTVYGKSKLFSEDGILVSTGSNVIDVSVWQNNIDWAAVKKSGKVNGAIVRIGYTGSSTGANATDLQFERNIRELKRLGIPRGVYYYGYVNNASDAIKEAVALRLKLSAVGNPYLYYGVWYDAEVSSIGRTNYEKVIPAFINNMKAAGYKTGVYGNASAFFSSSGYLNSSLIKQYPMWVAHYSTKCSYHYSSAGPCGYKNYYGWQYTSSGTVSGISGRVDMNFWYKV